MGSLESPLDYIALIPGSPPCVHSAESRGDSKGSWTPLVYADLATQLVLTVYYVYYLLFTQFIRTHAYTHA